MAQIPAKFFQVLNLPLEPAEPHAMYFVRPAESATVAVYVTDAEGYLATAIDAALIQAAIVAGMAVLTELALDAKLDKAANLSDLEDVEAARTALVLGSSDDQVFNSIELANPLGTAYGGTGASEVEQARQNLGVPADDWPIVESADDPYTATAAQSGTYFRLSAATCTFNLPTTDLVAGKTHFWLTFTTGDEHVVFPGVGKLLEYTGSDGFGSQVANRTSVFGSHLFHIRYVGGNVWASNVMCEA